MKKKDGIREPIAAVALYTSYLIAIIMVIILANVMTHDALIASDRDRAISELTLNAKSNIDLLTMEIDWQFDELAMVAGHLMLEDWLTESADHGNLIETYMEKNDVSTMGFADLDGNAVDYQGNSLGNVKERSFFSNIMDGKKEYVSLNTLFTPPYARSVESPKAVFAVPAYENGEMVGVFFSSKKTSCFATGVVMDTQFDGKMSMFVTNSEGDILLVSNEKDRNLLSENLIDDTVQAELENKTNEDLKRDLKEGKSGNCILKNGKQLYTVYYPVGINDWTIFCVANTDAVHAKYQHSRTQVKQLMFMLTAVYVMAILGVFVCSVMYRKASKRAKRQLESQYESYKTIMNDLTLPVFEYDVRDDKITGNSTFLEDFEMDGVNDLSNQVKIWKQVHPEFNHDGLIAKMDDVIKKGKVANFESVLYRPNKGVCWVKTILFPMNDTSEKVSKIFGAMLDVTPEHLEFENAWNMITYVPGGLHRCYLSDPIHLEYVSDGLCRMLGYTEQEVWSLVGPEQVYTNLLVEEDRALFESFAVRLSRDGGTDTCEYKMICKDGSLITVSDTMEVKDGADGVRYGYSTVTDVGKYKEAQKRGNEELEKVKEQLAEARIKVSMAQMQPHFLYNALASIREIVLDDPDYASDLIYDFATHLRACIKLMSSDDLIPFAQEVKNVKAYVNIEKMRFGDKLKVAYDIAESDFDIIPLSIQPLVENAIRHGIYERGSKGGAVTVSSYRDQDGIVIKIEDTGMGFNFKSIQEQVEMEGRDSTGLHNQIFRFEKMMDARVSVDSKIGVGTQITIRIPMRGEKDHESNYCG